MPQTVQYFVLGTVLPWGIAAAGNDCMVNDVDVCDQHNTLTESLLQRVSVRQSGSSTNDASNDACIREHYEVLDMNDADWASMAKAWRKLKESGEYDDVVQIHFAHDKPGKTFPHASGGGEPYWNDHQSPAVFAWHRAFQTMLETKLEEQGATVAKSGHCVAMPYWAYPQENDAAFDKLFGSSWLGGKDDMGGDCVTDGIVEGWTYPREWIKKGKKTEKMTCVTRKWKEKWPYTREDEAKALATASKATRTDQLWKSVANLHLMHENFENSNVQQKLDKRSPSDPLFFFIHSYVDYLWYKWQLDHDEDKASVKNLDDREFLRDFIGDREGDCMMIPTYSQGLVVSNGETQVGSETKSTSRTCYKYVDPTDGN